MKTTAIIAAAAILIAGCGGPDTGKIHDKRYNPAYTSPGTQTCSGTGTNYRCYPGAPTYYPESWEFDLYNGSDHGWTSVPQASWDRCKIGDVYPSC